MKPLACFPHGEAIHVQSTSGSSEERPIYIGPIRVAAIVND